MHLYLKYYLTESNVEAPMQSLPITTNVASSNPTQVIRNYVIKFVSYLRQVDGFLLVLWFTPPINLTGTI
jgi:hypothetical protein